MAEKKRKPGEKPEPKAAEAARPLAEKIGLAKLDLSVEEVEERISPRETNVFDK